MYSRYYCIVFVSDWCLTSKHISYTYFSCKTNKTYNNTRGVLVKDFLTSNIGCRAYLNKVATLDLAGFNLFVYDEQEGLFYYSNHTKSVVELDEGVYGISNGTLDSNWYKVV